MPQESIREEGSGDRTEKKPELLFNLRFINQHDRDIIFDWVNALALNAFEPSLIGCQFNSLLTQRANQDFQQF
jgi:hypothetical protein